MFSPHFMNLFSSFLFFNLESQLDFSPVSTCTDSFIKVNILSLFQPPELTFFFPESYLVMKLALTMTDANRKTSFRTGDAINIQN